VKCKEEKEPVAEKNYTKGVSTYDGYCKDFHACSRQSIHLTKIYILGLFNSQWPMAGINKEEEGK